MMEVSERTRCGNDSLRDHAAHRGAHEMRRLDPERIHQADRIPCHVDQLVGRGDRNLLTGVSTFRTA